MFMTENPNCFHFNFCKLKLLKELCHSKPRYADLKMLSYLWISHLSSLTLGMEYKALEEKPRVRDITLRPSFNVQQTTAS